MHRAGLLIRAARILVIALVVGLGISHIIFAIGDWHLRDAGAYWEAALRLRDGEPLYPVLADPEASTVYRYAPWLAWLTVPLTFLPPLVVAVGWSLTLVAASTAAMIPLARRRGWLAIAFFWPLLIGISAIGNVHPLLIAALALGIEGRAGPVWLAAAASLKAFPLLFVLTYIGRRQWWRAGASVALTGALVAPMLLYDVSAYPRSPGYAALLLIIPGLYAIVVAAGIVITPLAARSQWAWLAAATTVTFSLPRFFLYDLTYLVVGAAGRTRSQVDKP